MVYLIVGCFSLPSPLEFEPDQTVPEFGADASNASNAPDSFILQDMAQAVLDASTSNLEDAYNANIDAMPPCTNGVVCGSDCVDIETNPMHCGDCGFTCAFPNAQSRCEDGQCVLGSCDPGYFDDDEAPENGCELLDTCTPDEDCNTLCGSIGRSVCNQGNTSCTPPNELCNALDDNCDSSCDEGALPNCRVPVARAHGDGHAYHSDISLLLQLQYSIESAEYFYVYRTPYQGMRPMFLCSKPNGRLFLTSHSACELAMRAPLAEVGFWSPTPLCGSIPLYGLYHPAFDNHFYTTSPAERNSAVVNLGYQDYGILGYVWPTP